MIIISTLERIAPVIKRVSHVLDHEAFLHSTCTRRHFTFHDGRDEMDAAHMEVRCKTHPPLPSVP